MRWSLRSLDKHLPWFRGDIIIVQGDDLPPNWLNLSHPRVRIVHHRDFFNDTSVLPTFSSDAIHVNIHRIPGLGEYFINMCDDYLFGSPVEPSDWFRDGKMVLYHEKWRITGGVKGSNDLMERRGNIWTAKVYRTQGLFQERFPNTTDLAIRYLKHAPFVLSKSIIAKTAELFEQDFRETAAKKFRHWKTVDTILFHNFYCQV